MKTHPQLAASMVLAAMLAYNGVLWAQAAMPATPSAMVENAAENAAEKVAAPPEKLGAVGSTPVAQAAAQPPATTAPVTATANSVPAESGAKPVVDATSVGISSGSVSKAVDAAPGRDLITSPYLHHSIRGGGIALPK